MKCNKWGVGSVSVMAYGWIGGGVYIWVGVVSQTAKNYTLSSERWRVKSFSPMEE